MTLDTEECAHEDDRYWDRSLGTVGSGVVKILQDNAQKITDITGCKLNVKTVVVM